MGGGSLAKQYPYEYLTAAGMAACLNYPLWRASAVGQSGFSVASIHIGGVGKVPAALSPYVHAFAPPYKGMMSVVLGMTWARAAIFWGSDSGKDLMKNSGIQNESITTVLPTLMVSTLVQCVNQPLVRASVTLQNPKFDCPDTRSALRYIYKQYGWKGLWHGTSAGILKTVPKYCTAICVKDYIEVHYPASSDASDSDRLWRSAAKSACAGVAGAALTNPLDVIRNEMFKRNTPLIETVQTLYRTLGSKFLVRGMGKNMIAVAIPVGCTIFFTDALIQLSKQRTHYHNGQSAAE